jgi:hypothetical protein
MLTIIEERGVMFVDNTKTSILEHPWSMVMCMNSQSDTTKKIQFENNVPESENQ